MKKDSTVNLVKKIVVLLSAIVVLSISIIAQKKENKNWTGIYRLTDSAPNSKRQSDYDVVPMVEYVVTIKKTLNNQLTATFEANGMQTFEVYQCSVKETDSKLSFYFLSGGISDGGTVNPQGFRKSALLFTLVETKVGAKTKYQFQSGDYKLIRLSTKAKNQSVYFQKSK